MSDKAINCEFLRIRIGLVPGFSQSGCGIVGSGTMGATIGAMVVQGVALTMVVLPWKNQWACPSLVMVLIEVLVLLRLALLLKGSDGTGVLLILKVEGDGGVKPTPPPQAVLLLGGSNNKFD